MRLLPRAHLTGKNGGAVDDEPLDGRLHITNLDDGAAGQGDPSGICQLATAHGVERGPVQNQLDLVTLMGGVDGSSVDEHAGDPSIGDGLVIAGEVHRVPQGVQG